MTNVLALKSETNFTNDQIELIKNTVAKGTSNDEFQMFMYLANQYNLNPFLKEIFCIKYGTSAATIMTSRDGYLKYAQDNPDFAGMISFAVKEGDIFEVDASAYQVTHKFGAKRGKIIGAWAKCERKGKIPVICFVDFDEYNQKNSTWNKYPSAMIQKVAEVFVLKRQFGINGLVTREEMTYEEPQQPLRQAERTVDTSASHKPTKETGWHPTEAQQKRLYAIAASAGFDSGTTKGFMKQFAGKESCNELNGKEYRLLTGGEGKDGKKYDGLFGVLADIKNMIETLGEDDAVKNTVESIITAELDLEKVIVGVGEIRDMLKEKLEFLPF